MLQNVHSERETKGGDGFRSAPINVTQSKDNGENEHDWLL